MSGNLNLLYSKLVSELPVLEVDFTKGIPSNLKLKNGISKYILKKAMKGILPKEFLNRPKKGFSVPLTYWLKNWPIDLKSKYNFSSDFVARTVDTHQNRKRDNRLFLWNWIVLMMHQKSFNPLE